MTKQLHKKTQIEVQKLLDETGHVLALDDLPDILELDDLARKVTGQSGDHADIYRWPVKVGSLLFRPLTLGKIAWYNTVAKEWFADDAETQATMLAFLLSVDNDETFVNSLASPADAVDAINKWQRMVDATPDELASAVAMMIELEDGDSGDISPHRSSDGPLVAMLCREYGRDPDYWIFKESITVVRALIDDFTRRMNDEIRRHNATGGRKKAIAPIKTPSMEATLEFRKRIESMRERWSGNVG